MAGNKNSGGPRPLAPQNSPMNVNPLGGNGQSGKGTQAAIYVPGMKSLGSTGVETMALAGGAPLAGDPTQMGPTGGQDSMQPLTDINAMTSDKNQPITHGSDIGDGADSSSLNLPTMSTPTSEKPIQILQTLYMQDPTNQDLRFAIEGLSNQGRM